MATEESMPYAATTPILDSAVLGRRPRKKLRSKLLPVALGFLFGILLVQSANDPDTLGSPAATYTVLFYFLVLLLAVVVHEAGHLLAGWIVGFRFGFVSIGPFTLNRVHGRLKVRFRQILTGASGLAGMHVDGVRRLRRRLLVFIAGGPAANLLSVPATTALINYLFHATRNGWVLIPVHLFVWISLILGLVNLLPFSVGALFSDGARMAMLFRSRTRARRWLSIVALQEQTQKGLRPRDWKRTWLSAASSVQDGSIDDFRGNLLAYAAASGREDAPVAALHLEKCLELTHSVAPSTRDVLSLEAVVFTAWFRRDAETAQKWLEQVKKLKVAPQLSRLRADIAIRCTRKDFDVALVRWQEGLAFIEKLPVGAAQKGLKEGWLEWHEEIRQRQSGETASTASHQVVPHQA